MERYEQWSESASSEGVETLEILDVAGNSVPDAIEAANRIPRPLEKVLADAGLLDFLITEGEASGTLTGEKRSELREKVLILLPELKEKLLDATPEQKNQITPIIKHFESI